VHYNKWDDCTDAEKDAGYLLDWVTSENHWQQKYWKKEADNHQEQWEYDGDQNCIETAHFAYYAGHGVSTHLGWTKLVFKVNNFNIPYDSPRINPDYCDWGDEGPLKWVALASCYVGNKTYKALDGVHLICAAKCKIDEAYYGDDFGEYMVHHEWSIKSSWFKAMDLNKNVVYGVVNVVGEDSSVGNDHLYWHGSVAADPSVDNYYYEWTHDPNTGLYTQGGGHK